MLTDWLTREYLRGKYHCTVDLLFDWFGFVCFANGNKNCQLSYSWFQTSQTEGQWYSDTSPFSIPWTDWLNEERLEHVRHRDHSMHGSLWCLHFLLARACNSLSLFLTLSLSLSLSLTGQRERERERGPRGREKEGGGGERKRAER